MGKGSSACWRPDPVSARPGAFDDDAAKFLGAVDVEAPRGAGRGGVGVVVEVGGGEVGEVGIDDADE